jgi:hypothetical protein
MKPTPNVIKQFQKIPDRGCHDRFPPLRRTFGSFNIGCDLVNFGVPDRHRFHLLSNKCFCPEPHSQDSSPIDRSEAAQSSTVKEPPLGKQQRQLKTISSSANSISTSRDLSDKGSGLR